MIISEYPPKTPAYKSNFPQRNKIIAGLSDGTIVTQARENSGSLITAKHALSFNKPLFSFPWNIDNEIYKGNNLLLTNGAKCILSYKDILKNYPNLKLKESKKLIEPKITEEYKVIYDNLTTTPIDINILVQKTNIAFSELQYKLTLMEIENLVNKSPNNCWCKNT